MTRAIVWKEFREQGLIGLTLIVFGAGILVAAATLADPPAQGASPADVIRYLGAGLMAALMLAVTAGTVCGGALFAAEREAGTIGFLESLPVSRWQIWRAKLLAGLLMAAIEIAAVLACAAALGLVPTINWAISIAIFALLAFVWGAYGSTLAQTTLGSVGIAVPSATAAFIFYYLPLALIFQNPRTNMLQAEGGLIFLALMFVTPLLGSMLRFTRNDRERLANDSTPARAGRSAADVDYPPEQPDNYEPTRPRLGATALLWLCWRQLWKPGLFIALFAVFLGLSLLPDNVQPVLLWPGMALTAGVLAGVTAFMDEQAHGSSRFWGERRLPIARFWLVKLVVHFLFAVVLAGLLVLPSALRAELAGMQARGGSFLSFAFRSLLFDGAHLGSHGWRLLAMPLIYGFAAGHLCSLLFKKAVVAAGVAGVVGGSLAAFWLPSLLSGGTLHWQLWTPTILALVTSRLLIRAWSAERLPLRPLIGGCAAILIAIALGLGWRVLEVPDDPVSEDDMAYVASLPPLELNDSGRQFRTATERFARVAGTIPFVPALNARAAPPPERGSVEERIAKSPFQGWSDDPEVANWLENAYSLDTSAGENDEPWYAQAEKAGREKPDGIFEHPLRTGSTASLLTQANGRRMGITILAHGLQKQAAGDNAAFPSDLRTALALSRTLRNGSVASALTYGNEVARAAFAATDRWLAAFDGSPDELRRAMRVLQDDDPAAPFDPRPHLLSERFVLRELVKAPAQFLPAQLTPPGRDRDQVSAVVDLIGTMWNVPWERERTRRLLGVGFETGETTLAQRLLVRGRPGVYAFLTRRQTPGEMTENDRQLRLYRRVVLLEIAVRLYRLEKGAAPQSVEALIQAGYLPSAPVDPYDDRPLRYRISEGEVLPAPQPPMTPMMNMMKPAPTQDSHPIPAGQALIWSVGIDRSDDGGRNAPMRPGTMRNGADLVFLIPPAPAKP